MGKGIFFLIGAAMFGATALMMGAKTSTFEGQEQQSEYEEVILARDIAESGHDEALSAIRRELNNVDTDWQDVNMMGGNYDKQIAERHYGNMDVTVAGTYGGATHTVKSNVIFAVPFPAAVALSDDEVDVRTYGSALITGVDHRAPSGGSGGGYLRPVYGIETNDVHINSIRDEVGDDQVVGAGDGGQASLSGTFDATFYEEIYEEASTENLWDRTIDSTWTAEQRWTMLQSEVNASSVDNPTIIRVLGDITIDSALEGHGLLVVEDGDLNVTSNGFDWEGLVMVRKESRDTVRVNLRNNAQVHGGFVGYSVGETGAEEPEQECAADFDIEGNETVVSEDFRIKITVLGAAISMGGQYDMPVTTKIIIGGESFEPFGPYDSALSGNVNTGNSGDIYTWEPDTVFPANTGIKIRGRSWKKKYDRYSGSYWWNWQTHMSKDTDTVDNQLSVLRDGNSVPDVGGYQGQYAVQDFISDYIDTDADAMKLEDGQSIYLFELGMNDPDSPAHDMQDLVVLITMTRASASGAGEVCEDGVHAASRIEYNMHNSAAVNYSPEAIARLGKRLDTIKNSTRVVVVSNETINE